MNRYRYSSGFETVGDSKDPDIIYYNASIVNNNTDDSASQIPLQDPQIRFNETRDTAIVKDASQYQFSIIRFVMNGANKDLPLFIPAIQSSTGQTDVNLTEYGFGIALEAQIGGTNYNIAPPLSYAIYDPETRNNILAPLPRSVASPNYIGVWDAAVTYSAGQQVYYNPDGRYYQANVVPNVAPPNLNQLPPTAQYGQFRYWSQCSSELGQPQDLSTRYYWVYTYSHWVNIMNTTLDTANRAIYTALFAQGLLPLTTYTEWLAQVPSPVMSYNNSSGLFSISYPSSYASPQSITIGTTVLTAVKASLYLNNNMEGLFANFDNVYLNTPVHPAPYGWINAATPVATLFPDGYCNLQIVKALGLNNNLVSGSAILPTPTTYTGIWYVMTQDYLSTTTLWSPIDSIVFTSTLLPIQNEQTAPPNSLGTRNTGNSSATSQSAFSPIITDIALDLQSDPTAYRKMIYYSPAAEYRMSDFQNSKEDIRNIDIQVWWKSRLDNNLYPVSMFNLTSVSFKLMFRKKNWLAKGDR